MTYLVRSHQCKSRSGLALNHNGQVLTVFSASNYYWTMWPGMHTSAHPNDGSILIFDDSLKNPSPQQYTWEPILLPVDNPTKSPILALTGQPFQYCVPQGRLYDGFTSRTDAMLAVDAIVQRMSELTTRLKQYDSDESGIISRDVFMIEIRNVVKYIPCYESHLDLKPFLLPRGRLHYRKYLDEQMMVYRTKNSDWHCEVMLTYAEHMRAQGQSVTRGTPKEQLRTTLRKIFPVEFFSEDQMSVFLERYYDQSSNIGEGRSLSVEWAVDRRKERVESVRQRLKDEMVDINTLRTTLIANSAPEAEGLLKPEGVVASLSSLGVPVTDCFVKDMVEEIGRRRESLDEPGTVGWISVETAVELLMTEPTNVSDARIALGLSQAFLTVLYKYRDDLIGGEQRLSISVVKQALLGMNKANNYPLSHVQISAVLLALDENHTGYVDDMGLSRMMAADE